MALALIGRVLLGPGDVIAVEQLGYQPAWRALSAYGAKLRAVPVDAQGLDVAALARLCAHEPVRAVYVTPHHQYPTTVTMSAGRRMALLQLAREKKLAIIEDDYDHEFHYEGRPVLPLASADDNGHVLYIGTMSKIFAPGLRVGYLLAPHAVRQAALSARFDLDRQGDRITELALAELLEDGELQRHVFRTRRIYRARRDHCVERIRAQLGDFLSVEPPTGGIALWARVAPELDITRFAAEALARGVVFQQGDLFSFGGKPTQHVRIGYGGLTEKEMGEAVTRLRKAALAAR
jgi:GntR family transcriptional regulator/MocR family aminotransferase